VCGEHPDARDTPRHGREPERGFPCIQFEEESMSPVVRRVVYAVTYEIIAIIFVTVMLSSLGHAGESAGLVAVASSAVALIWNFTFNTLFEKWEMRQASRKRTLGRRVAHSIGFE